MVEISTPALMMSIQAISQLISEEEATMDSMEESEDLYELAESVEAFRKTLNELRSVYEAARRDGADLPPYGNLVL
ncbi:hypothetical protein [Marivita sp.]|uniref:hypothetical protein n=1 Tax=Marivita sp. TaxID=2003365 RepID=UPI003F6E4E73